MTIKDLREIIVHFQEHKYDDYEVVLWDFNHQQKLNWNVSHALSHPDKELTFPVEVKETDEKTINEKLKNLIDEYYGKEN